MEPEHDSAQSPDPLAELSNLRRRVERLERDLAALQQAPPPPLPAPLSPPLIPATSRATTGSPAPPPVQPSLESRLGAQVFNRVGIVALLFATAWFLKLAIDNQWIGATGRVLIGLAAGAGIILWSERFRRHGATAFSFSLKAVGSGVLYLSLWAAFQLYHLLPASAALAAMILVTGWNASMSWSQDSAMLAAYALAGGLLTPILLSTGGDHEVFLFTYLLALDLTTILLVRLKPWPKLLLAALPATAAYFIGWYVQHFHAYPHPNPAALTATFVTLFFLTFSSVPIHRTLISSAEAAAPHTAPDSTIANMLLPLGNAAFGSLALYSILQDSGHHDALAWMTLAFAAFFLALMRLPQPALARAIHLSLSIVFLTVTIPIKATGRWITLGWLAEGVALLFISARLLPSASAAASRLPGRILRLLASASLALGVIGLLFLPFWIDANVAQSVFNPRFATGLAGLAALALAAWIALHPKDTDPTAAPRWSEIAAASTISFNLVALQTGIREIHTYWTSTTPSTIQPADTALQAALSVSAFLLLYAAVLLAAGFWRRSAFIRWQALILLVLAIAKTFLYDMRNLSGGYRALSFLALGILLMAISFAYGKDWLSLKAPANSEPTRNSPPHP